MTNINKYDNLIAFHPGSYVEDIIDDLNITQAEFARRLGTSPKTVSGLVSGKIRLSEDLAFKLEKMTGVDFQTWMNIQNSYDKKILEIQDAKNRDEILVADMIDIKYFKKHEFFENRVYSKKDKIKELRNFFSVSNLTYFLTFNPAVSYRSIGNFKENQIVNSNIMLELASIRGRNKARAKLNRSKLQAHLPEIRNMVNEDFSIFYPRLEQILLNCGIVLEGLPSLKNSMLNGATKKFGNGSALILITDRNKGADIFWFSLIHEISHILDNDFYTNIEDIEQYREKENKADKFAKDFFIREESYEDFVSKGNFTTKAITDFSQEMNVQPFILLGRLKKDEYVKYNQFTEYMTKYKLELNDK
ncbi:MAG: HigA family addiction module antitoxin [Bacillota bacterium]|nr:HigA family addiction module antitoxin [Bacillota bacterium]